MRLTIRPVSLLLFAMLTLLCACAGVKPTPSTDPELAKRIEAYWALRVSRDLAESYRYETPDFRQKYKLTPYIAELSSGILHTAELGTLTVDGDRAKALMKVTYDVTDALLPGGGSVTRELIDHWQRIEGVWYHLYFPPKAEAAPGEGAQKTERSLWRLPGGNVFEPAPPATETDEKKR